MVSKKNLLIFMWFICVPVMIFADPLQYLTKTIVSETAFDTAPSRWRNPNDDDDTRFRIGFNFPFNGTTYNRVRVSTNGALTFGSNGDFSYQNEQIPHRDLSIFPYWDDMNPQQGGNIRYGRLDRNGANDRFVVSWEGVPHYNNSGSYTFQVVLYKNGSIRFRYDATSDADGTLCTGGCTDYGNNGATIGVQEDGTHYDQHSYDSAIDQTKDVLYTIPPDVQIIKSSCVISDTVNNNTNPKRIPGATIRYAFEVSNTGARKARNVIVDDNLNSNFDYSTIQNLQIQSSTCDCLGVTSASNNGANGTANGENPVKLDFGTVASGSTGTPTIECGYFEVDIK